MSSDQSIRIRLITVYICIVILLLGITIFFDLAYYWHILFLVLLMIPEAMLLSMLLLFSKNKVLFGSIFFLLILEMSTLFLFIKKLRLFFPSTQITETKTIGFIHFSGYPFWFDTIVYLTLIVSPLVCMIAYKGFRYVRGRV